MLEATSNDSETGYMDPDVDDTTEEGAQAVRQAEESLYAGVEAQVREQQEAAIQARLRQIPNVNVAQSIPNELYKKAYKHQADLTDSERALLMSRGDLVGRALAGPHSLSLEERYKVMGRPHPNVVRSRVQYASQGTISEPIELHKKATEALERGELTSLTDEELKLVANNFCEEGVTISLIAYAGPGDVEAANLLSNIEGFDIQVRFKVAAFILTNPVLKARQTIQKSGGDGGAELEEIADALHLLQEERESGSITEAEFVGRSKSQITAIRTIARHRSRPYPQPFLHPLSLPEFVPGIHQEVPWRNPRAAHRSVVRQIQPLADVQASTPSLYEDQPQTIKETPRFNPFPCNRNTMGPGNMPSWPFHTRMKHPRLVLLDDMAAEQGLDVDSLDKVWAKPLAEMSRRWDVLSNEERAAYEKRSEELRQKAWDEHDKRVAAREALREGLNRPENNTKEEAGRFSSSSVTTP